MSRLSINCDLYKLNIVKTRSMGGAKPPKVVPGDGLRSLKSTMLFRAVNYELYVKPVSIATITDC